MTLFKSTNDNAELNRLRDLAVQQQMENAADDLVMRKYLLDKRPKDKGPPKAPDPFARGGQTGMEKVDEAQRDDDERKASDDEFDDDDEELGRLREQRMAQMRKQVQQQQEWLVHGHGEYSEIIEEEFLKTVTASGLCAVHFYHKDFERCKIVDKHLAVIATKLLPIKFCKLNADKAPFFVSKLGVKVLPSIILFDDGIAKDRIVGFGDLGGSDDFSTAALHNRIAKSLLKKDSWDDM
eukprot:TRINITY_DN106881_c0_g1_i1.p1 TRINITY_DN106881_c0_g1~~TRINITY_DN106881_c0_g1_i1.p1  ORF type:complete len:238 (-),score=44.73 TRINITY_DN106881_c0_g1_i1:114-827(-)